MTAVDERVLAIERERAAQDEDFFGVLLPQAADLVVTAGLGSTAMLQRKMRRSWAVVSDLMLELHELGVVGPDRGEKPREVLVAPEGLPDLLARIADLAAGEDEDEDGEEDGEAVADVVATPVATPPATPVVSLVKPNPPHVADEGGDDEDWGEEDATPGGELVPRLFGRLATRHTGELATWQPDEVPHLVTRLRQATARGSVWVADQPPVARGLAVGRQAPKAATRLVIWTPRGALRVATRLKGWLTDEESLRLLAKHEAAGEGESYAKVAEARAKKNLAGRRWLVAAVAGVAVLAVTAWHAPSVFAGLLATLVGLGVAAAGRTSCRNPSELTYLALAAVALGWLAWWQGPFLATFIPRPPVWVWWILLGGLVVLFGLLGRKEDQKLVEMPAHLEDVTRVQRPTADMIIDALCRLGIKALTPANLAEVQAETRVIAPGVGRSPRGYHLQLELPWAVTAGQVMEKRQGLAAALKREMGTVWPSQGPRHPGHLVLFLSDLPMSTSPQGPWPVAETRRVDIFEPIPMFTDQEGRWIDLQIAYKRILIGGESGSGKSFYLRQIAVACGLDPRVRIVVFDGKANGDMDPLMPIAHGFYIGAQPEEMEQQLKAARAIEREMDRRSRFLRTLPREENPENKVTSALVDKYPDLAPYLFVVDELQEYTQNEDKDMAKEFSRIFTRFSRLGRSAGIIPAIATQYPADGVVPVAMRSNFSTKFCLRVEGHQQVEVILGTGSYAAGMKANLFTASEAGLAWHKGDGQDPAIVRSVRGLDGPACDQLVEVARALRKSRGLLTGQAADDGIEDAEIVISILDDVEAAMRQRGCGRAQWGQLVPWLQEMRPGHYADLDEDELSARIRSAGVKPRGVKVEGRNRNGIYLSDLRKRGADDEG